MVGGALDGATVVGAVVVVVVVVDTTDATTPAAASVAGDGPATSGPALSSLPEQLAAPMVSRATATRTRMRPSSRPTGAGSDLPELHLGHAVIARLVHDQRRAVARRRDVLGQVLPVDLPPDAVRRLDGVVLRQVGEVAEVRAGIDEHRPPEGEEALDVPVLDVGLLGVDVDREVEVVADEL